MEDGLVPGFLVFRIGCWDVLILVVMEDGLVLCYVAMGLVSLRYVLILVVMEDGLVLLLQCTLITLQVCLNPCCNGRWSRTCY